MKRKVLWAVVIGALGLVLIMGVARYFEIQNCQADPNWLIANEIYKVENALKEVDVNASFPGDFFNVNTKAVALLNMVIEHCGKKVVCRADSVEVTREVKINILHRHDLSVSAASSASLHTENRTERRLAKCNRDALSYF